VANNIEILISDWVFDSEFLDKQEQAIKNLENDVKELTTNFELRLSNIGLGADSPSILIHLLAVVNSTVNVDTLFAIFYGGEILKNNISAWVSMTKSITSFLKKLKKKHKDIRINNKTALLLALELISKKEAKLSSIELAMEKTFTGTPVFFKKKFKEHLDYNPDALYLFGFKVNDEIIYILGIKSNGKIEINYSLKINEWWTFLEDN